MSTTSTQQVVKYSTVTPDQDGWYWGYSFQNGGWLVVYIMVPFNRDKRVALALDSIMDLEEFSHWSGPLQEPNEEGGV